MADLVLQFLEKLSPEEHSCQVFAIEERELESGSQIVSMTKKVTATNKVS